MLMLFDWEAEAKNTSLAFATFENNRPALSGNNFFRHE